MVRPAAKLLGYLLAAAAVVAGGYAGLADAGPFYHGYARLLVGVSCGLARHTTWVRPMRALWP